MSDDTTLESCGPIACTLGAGDLGDRIAEWQSFFRQSVISMETSPSVARLRLGLSDDVLIAAASLGQLEKECCAFFDFAISLEPGQRWLTVRVPAGAEETLASFTDMLTRHGIAT